MFIARNTVAFVVAYLVLMVPTYILPYFGSNSTLVNGLSIGLGMGPTPQWWAHVWFLTMLMVLAWLRGGAIGKVFLPVFPVLAAAFDLTPGLSAIPLIPTFLHLGGIILGAMAKAEPATEAAAITAELVLARRAKFAAALSTLLVVGGGSLFATGLFRGARAPQAPSAPVQAKAPAPPASPAPASRASSVQAQPSAQSAGSPTPQAPTPPAPTAVAAHKPEPRARAPKSHPAEAKAPATAEKPTVRYIRLDD
ncbi:MAG: hypothetical protein PHU46_16570 [Rhodocyclaceae bacterium]|nr:hypothetical protein [Rhodocyclaceae bacterium]